MPFVVVPTHQGWELSRVVPLGVTETGPTRGPPACCLLLLLLALPPPYTKAMETKLLKQLGDPLGT